MRGMRGFAGRLRSGGDVVLVLVLVLVLGACHRVQQLMAAADPVGPDDRGDRVHPGITYPESDACRSSGHRLGAGVGSGAAVPLAAGFGDGGVFVVAAGGLGA